MRLKAIIDEEARLSDAIDKGEERGIEIGIERGKEEGIELGVQKVAREMLAANVDVNMIQQFTGLTLQQIHQLQEKYFRLN